MTEHTRKQFDAEMEAIRSGVLTMGGLVETQMSRAIALIEGKADDGLAGQVGADEQAINQMQVDMDLHAARSSPSGSRRRSTCAWS